MPPTPWLTSVFVNGPSLGAAMEKAGLLPEESVRRLAAGLTTALAEIHRTGLIHRDLKPENVLLAEDGVRVIDFGIARVAQGTEATELTQTGWVVGSPAFMSPEQAEGRELTPSSDVFSLGAVLAMAATGDSPFAGTSMAGTLYNVVHLEADLSTLTPWLRTVVRPCLAKDPAARPTPEQLLTLIGPVAAADRPWPPAVHRTITAQQADIDRLLDDTDRALVCGSCPDPSRRRGNGRSETDARPHGPPAPTPSAHRKDPRSRRGLCARRRRHRNRGVRAEGRRRTSPAALREGADLLRVGGPTSAASPDGGA